MTQFSEAISREDATKRAEPLASIIVNNFNYGRFLPQAIESALNQQYPHIEVIVVDDGSTDDSREIIASYGSRIKPVLKSNGGQASALNAGFAVSRGDLMIFLDADDILFPEAVTNVVPRLFIEGVSKVHWPMWVIDASGAQTGGTRPAQVPPEGDFRQQVLERGPSNVASSPTSGNAWTRSFLEKILPIPEDLAYYRSCADEYLYNLAPVFGRVLTISQPQGCYRLHGGNVYSSCSLITKLKMEVDGYKEQCSALSAVLSRNGIAANVEDWRQHSWFHRLDRALAVIRQVIPAGNDFVLIDGETWGVGPEFEGRAVHSFSRLGGVDCGPPADDPTAITCFASLLANGVTFLVLGWPCFWWLTEYQGLFRQLDSISDCGVNNSDLIIYDLRKCAATSAVPV